MVGVIFSESLRWGQFDCTKDVQTYTGFVIPEK